VSTCNRLDLGITLGSNISTTAYKCTKISLPGHCFQCLGRRKGSIFLINSMEWFHFVLSYKREANSQTELLLLLLGSQKNLLACHVRPATSGRSQDLATGRTGRGQGRPRNFPPRSLTIRLHSLSLKFRSIQHTPFKNFHFEIMPLSLGRKKVQSSHCKDLLTAFRPSENDLLRRKEKRWSIIPDGSQNLLVPEVGTWRKLARVYLDWFFFFFC
jgi:hypothetical protein